MTRIHSLFGDVIAPRLDRWLGDGVVLQVEGLNERQKSCGIPEHHTAIEVCRQLDMKAHIDYLHITRDGAVRGLSARAQAWRPDWADAWPWDTFTIRTRHRGPAVEADHLRRAAANPAEGLLSPGLFVQAYIRDGRADSVAMVRTIDLIGFVDCPPIGVRPPRSQPVAGGNLMVAVPWDALSSCGYRMWRWPEP